MKIKKQTKQKHKKKKSLLSKYIPKKTKFARLHKGDIPSIDYKPSVLTSWYNGATLVALKATKLDAKYMERTRLLLAQNSRKSNEIIWNRIKTTIPVTKKPLQVRMGKGKGKVHNWISRIPVGRVLLEIRSRTPGKDFFLLKKVASVLKIPSCVNYKKNFGFVH